MSQQESAVRLNRRVWGVAIAALLLTVTVPYLGLVLGAGAAYYAHKQGVVPARNVLVAAVVVMTILALAMTPVTSVGSP